MQLLVHDTTAIDLATRYGWVTALDCAAAFMLTVGLLWLLVHPERRIDGDPVTNA